MTAANIEKSDEIDVPYVFLKLIGKHPTLVIAAASLFTYFITVRYISGYLSFFSAETSWFDLTPFRMMSFASFPLMVSLLITMLYCLIFFSI